MHGKNHGWENLSKTEHMPCLANAQCSETLVTSVLHVCYLGVVLWDSICLFVAWIHETCFVTEWSPQNCNQETVNSPMACPKASGAQLCFRFLSSSPVRKLHHRRPQTVAQIAQKILETSPDHRHQLEDKMGDKTWPQDQGAGHSIPGWRTSWETGRQVGRQDKHKTRGAGHSIPGWRTSWETGRQDKHKTREPDTASQAEEQAGRLGDKLRDKTGNKTKTRPGSRTQHPRLKNKLADWETSSETRPGSRTQHPRLKNKLGDWETSWETRQTQDQGAGTQHPRLKNKLADWETRWETRPDTRPGSRTQHPRLKNKLGDWETSWETRPGSRAQHPRLKIKLFWGKTETNLHKCM